MSSCLQGLRVLLTDLGSDQQIQAEQLASKLGATLIPAVSNTLPDVLVAGRAGSLTCKVTRYALCCPSAWTCLAALYQHCPPHVAECQAGKGCARCQSSLAGGLRPGGRAGKSVGAMSSNRLPQPAFKLLVCLCQQFLLRAGISLPLALDRHWYIDCQWQMPACSKHASLTVASLCASKSPSNSKQGSCFTALSGVQT